MPRLLRPQMQNPSAFLLAYSALLAAVAGWVNSVALLVWMYPVGNLTALTTKIGQHTTNPSLHPAGMIAAIVAGFLGGVLAAGTLLAPAQQSPSGPRHAAVLLGEAGLLLAAAAIEHPLVRAALAAAACGLQNGMTSSFPGMPIRTTHFTGTITDLGLLLARSHRHGMDSRKAGLLTLTVFLFVAGAAGGVIIGGQIGDHALIPAAVVCLFLGLAHMATPLSRRTRTIRSTPCSGE